MKHFQEAVCDVSIGDNNVNIYNLFGYRFMTFTAQKLFSEQETKRTVNSTINILIVDC